MRLEPRQLARDQRVLEVDLPLTEFPRLRDEIVELVEPVAVRVHFRRDEQSRIRVEGRVRAHMRMNCGNCSEIGAFEIDVPIDLCVVRTDEAARGLMEDADPLVLESVEATPADLFEDDLLLALPDRPCSGSIECPYRPDPQALVAEPDDEEDGAGRKASPFAVLATLKSESDEG